jgi:hypothetical protein
LSHHLSRLELYYCSWWDFKAAPRLIRIPPNSLFRESNFEYSKIPKFDSLAARKAICDQVERSLNYFKHLMLNQARIVADLYDNIPLRQVSHRESFHRFEIKWHFRGHCRQRSCRKRPTVNLFRTMDENANEARD